MTYQLTQNDYKIRYKDTYIGIKNKDTGEIDVAFVMDITKSIDDKKYYISVKVLDAAKEDFISEKYPIDSEDLILSFPKTGAINTQGGSVLVVRRVKKKQWRVCLTSSTVHVSDPFIEERTILKLPYYEDIVNNSLLKALFNPVYFSFKEAVSLVSSYKRLAAAIDSKWFVGILHKPNRICIFREGFPVAHIRKDGKIVLIKSLYFLKEELEIFGPEVVLV